MSTLGFMKNMECSYMVASYERGIDHSIMNDDLLVEILVRLPLKSLSRFKCVSKSWRRLISDKYLQKRLPLISTGVFFRSEADQFKEPKYAYTSQDGTIQDFKLNFFPFHEESTIVDGCNGLLLYYTSLLRTYYVVNTTTKRWVSLPIFHKRTQLSILAFDPYSSSQYKVVCFTEFRKNGAELEIYSSETDRWDHHEIQFGVETDAMSATMHYFNGIMYVLAHPNFVASINFTKISCDLIELPEPINRDAKIGHSQGRIHYAHIDGDTIKIWMLKDLSSSEWKLKHEIDLRVVTVRKVREPNQVNLLAFHPEKDLVYLWVLGKMVCYNLGERKLEGFWEFGKDREKAFLIQIWLFPCSNYLTKCLA